MANNRKIFIFENSYKLTNYLVKRWVEIAKDAIYTNNRFVAAIPGGRTPVEFYSKLSSMDNYYLWQNTHLFLTDERFVPEGNRDSNFRMIKENLLNDIPVPPENVHPVKTNFVRAAQAAENYAGDMRRFFGGDRLPRFDVVVLGIGEDGHIASLFPGARELEESERWAVALCDEKIKHERISLTLPVINQARHVFFLVCGRGKAGIIKKIIEEGQNVPASMVDPKSGELEIFLDNDASSQLVIRDEYAHLDDAIVIS